LEDAQIRFLVEPQRPSMHALGAPALEPALVPALPASVATIAERECGIPATRRRAAHVPVTGGCAGRSITCSIAAIFSWADAKVDEVAATPCEVPVKGR
jgi:hypothetical protein